MVILAVCCLIGGVVCGRWLLPAGISSLIIDASDWVLYLLMILVGISVGLNKEAFLQIRRNPARILIIPLGITVGSIIGGAVGGLILRMPLHDSVPITAAMGWYSLSGVLMTNLSGAEAGAVSFLCNLIREILSFLIIPFIARYIGHYASIAPAGATSEDTTLPMFLRCTSEEIVIMAVLNGAICSALVPFLTPFLFRIFR
ncbi:MAG: lysine exporter LysO family protein [Oscillospiraceae bacterium]|nr:lysine exporter LysO family protein [Oscillospiraceae bacterium]